MRYAIVLLMTLIGLGAEARSLDPCTPYVQANTTPLYCSQGDLSFSFKFHTLMSGPECHSHREITSATITVSRGREVPQTLEARPGTFTYTLGNGANEGQFDSDSLNLHLRSCIAPLNGGFSIGN